MELLNINGRKIEVGEPIAAAIATIERDYKGSIEFDNGQAEGSFVAYGFTGPVRVQIGVRLNKRKLTLYVRERCPDGRLLEAVVPGLVIADRYDGRNKVPVHSIHNGRVRYLKPAEAPVLRLELLPEQLGAVLDACLGLAPSTAAEAVVAAPATSPALAGVDVRDEGTVREEDTPAYKVLRRRNAVTPEDLLAQLDRRSETGRLGEHAALQYEIARLRKLGCTEPERYVKHVALADVGVGYDIESVWPGQERCIEVKATTVPGADFFISTNEREVLQALGPKAWIYRVELTASGDARIEELQDPMNRIPDHHFTPQVWRVRV